jgi:hypothetical protein
VKPLRAAVCAALILSGCGYNGEPAYPLLNIPEKVKDLRAVQRGASIVYQFTLPDLTTEGKQSRIGEVEIRVGEAGGDPFEEGAWAARSIRVGADPDASGQVQGKIPAAPWAGKDVALAVKVRGENRKDLGWSTFQILSVIEPLPAPSVLRAEPVAAGVRVSWSGPTAQYRVFRRGPVDKELLLLGTVDGLEWVDSATEYGKPYRYVVQASRTAGRSEAESEVSEPVDVTPEDRFPPATPVGLSAIAAAEKIELVWERNTEADLAGYSVYRAAAGGEFEKAAEVDSPAYSDMKLELGKTYRYAVSALDRLGNESARSEPVEIPAP